MKYILILFIPVVLLQKTAAISKQRVELAKIWAFLEPSTGINNNKRNNSESIKQKENDNIDGRAGVDNKQQKLPPQVHDYTFENNNDDDVAADDLYSKTFVELYEIGVDRYLENNFRECVVFLEAAVHEYRNYRQAVVNCRMECWFDNERARQLMVSTVEDLPFYDRIVQRTICLGKCHNRLLQSQYLPPFYLHRMYRDLFENLRPYEYLQLCYYKEEELSKAASAAYTVLIADPGNTLMLSNMQYYLEVLKIDVNAIKDVEEKPFIAKFMDGKSAYYSEDYNGAVQLLEDSLYWYLAAEDECRAFCDGEFDHGNWYPDFITAVGNHFTFNLYCKQNCTRDLSRIRGEIYPNIVATHLEYLQLAYYKIGDVKAACHALGGYLLFHPDNEEMKFNREYYQQADQVPDSYFKAKTNIQKYFERVTYERKILGNFLTEYQSIYKDENERKRPRRKQFDGGISAQFATNGTDNFGNGACIIKDAINLFRQNVLEIT